MKRRPGGYGLWVTALCWSLPLTAAAEGQLRWQAPRGCPTQQEVERSLARVESAGRLSVDAVVARDAQGYRLRLQVEGAGQRFERELQASSCEVLAESAVFLVELAGSQLTAAAPKPGAAQRARERSRGRASSSDSAARKADRVRATGADAASHDHSRGRAAGADAASRGGARVRVADSDAAVRGTQRERVADSDATVRDARGRVAGSDSVARGGARGRVADADAAVRGAQRERVADSDATLRDHPGSDSVTRGGARGGATGSELAAGGDERELAAGSDVALREIDGERAAGSDAASRDGDRERVAVSEGALRGADRGRSDVAARGGERALSEGFDAAEGDSAPEQVEPVQTASSVEPELLSTALPETTHRAPPDSRAAAGSGDDASLRLGFGAAMIEAGLSGVAPHFALDLSLALDEWSVGLRVGALLHPVMRVAEAAEVDLLTSSAQLLGCRYWDVARVFIGPCMVVSALRTSADSTGLTGQQSSSASWLSAGPALQLQLRVMRSVLVGIELGAWAALTPRPSFEVAGNTVARAGTLAGYARLGAAYELW